MVFPFLEFNDFRLVPCAFVKAEDVADGITVIAIKAFDLNGPDFIVVFEGEGFVKLFFETAAAVGWVEEPLYTVG